MAAPANKSRDVHVPGPASQLQYIQQINNIITALRGICAKLDADAGVTDTNYTALWLDSAIATAPAKIDA